METETLRSAIESMLFVTDRPVTIARLLEVLTGDAGPTEAEIETAVKDLVARYAAAGSGVELRESQGGFHFTTRKANAAFVQKFLASKPFRLGRSALEALAIIAYRQPITRADIDRVRGIDSSHLLRTLIERGLVRMVGKADIPGRPVVYGTSPKFLETIGLKALGELPPLSELEELQGHTEDPQKALEAGLEKFLTETQLPDELQLQATDGLEEIEGMIGAAKNAPAEIYPSKIHAETAAENEAARQCWQDFAKKPRRPRESVTYEELAMPPMEPLPREAPDEAVN